MIKLEQVSIVIIGAALVILSIFFIEADGVAEAAAIGYLTVLAGYLGISMAKTITESGMKPRGEFADGKRWKYYLSAFLTLCIFAAVMTTGRDLGAAGAALSTGFFVILAALISMIQGNKIATLKDGT